MNPIKRMLVNGEFWASVLEDVIRAALVTAGTVTVTYFTNSAIEKYKNKHSKPVGFVPRGN
jgi:hypothetical protein